jgi:hypothetical protein
MDGGTRRFGLHQFIGLAPRALQMAFASLLPDTLIFSALEKSAPVAGELQSESVMPPPRAL